MKYKLWEKYGLVYSTLVRYVEDVSKLFANLM